MRMSHHMARPSACCLVVLALVAACTSPAPPPAPRAPSQTVVLISLDGFRYDYLDRPAAANLRALAARGVRARWMVPVFPSKTFPNHYSQVTGLYAEHHGVISNTMWDSTLGWFSLADSSAPSRANPRWWGGEPLWVAAVRQGRKSATFFWPGSDVEIAGTWPTYWRRYDGRVPRADRVTQVLDWLALPADSAPVFVTLYFSDVDGAGHDFGPDADRTDSAIARVDSAVGALVSGIAARGLGSRVNVIVVADHGMAATSPERYIYLDDYVDVARVTVIDWSPVALLAPKAGTAEDLYRALAGKHPHLTVYRKADVPARLHYRVHPRIPPIVAVADEGWEISTRRRIAERPPQPGGTHGYDPAVRSMGALFVAAGPAFAQGKVVEPFTNVHLYPLMAHVLGLKPAPNDGSLDSVRAVLKNGGGGW